jgi:DNA replication protein DnaC
MQSMENLTRQAVQTATQELLTPGKINMLESDTSWAEWLGIQTYGDADLSRMVDACADFGRRMRDKHPPCWLTLLGTVGTGKTHCCRKLFTWANSRLENGKTISKGLSNYHRSTAYTPHPIYWPDFVQQLRAGEAFTKREDMKRWPVLFLDDIGAERDPSGFAAEELHTLLGCRVGKWTLLTGNMTPEKIEAMDARIFSRIIRDRNILVTIETTDYSLRNKA